MPPIRAAWTLPRLGYMPLAFWTLGYDTIYAHQDREDDALAGIKSSARWLGSSTKTALVIFYSATLIALLYAAFGQGLAG